MQVPASLNVGQFPRFAFDAPVEMTDPITKSHIAGRVTEIGQRGCFVEAENLRTVDSIVQLRIHKSGNVFETWARVVHNRSGMGCYFIDTAPNQTEFLAGWLEDLKRILANHLGGVS
ncbi:MAG: PilZ domain-containing protein [Ktedonobacteraceae bacterium]